MSYINLGGGSGAQRCSVYGAGGLTISDSTETVVTYDTEEYDNDTMHSTVSNTGRITFTTAGGYIVMGRFDFAASATGYRYSYGRINGATAVTGSRVTHVGNASAPATLHSTFVVNAAAADYVEFLVWQNTAGDLALNGGSGKEGHTAQAVRIW